MYSNFFKNIFYISKLSIYFLCLILAGCRQESARPETSHTTPIKIPESVPGTKTVLIQQLKQRIENFNDPLSYCEFLNLQTKGQINQSEANELIDFAYGNNNPVLFKTAETTIAPGHYSLNFLWLSSTPVSEKDPLTGSDEERFQKNILKPMSDWQSKQPDAYINFWYDGNLVKAGSLNLTMARLQQSGINLTRLRFRNVRDIAAVKSNQELFAENISLYFRVDLAKAVIIDHVLRIDKVPYVATIDTDVVAITLKQLFDQRTLDALNTHGYIFGTAFTLEENSFIMLYNNPTIDIVKYHRDDVVNSSLAIAKEKIRENNAIAPQTVYHRYAYFRAAVNKERGPWNKKLGIGKNMIFPPSQFGGGGYSDEQITALKRALVTIQGCP